MWGSLAAPGLVCATYRLTVIKETGRGDRNNSLKLRCEIVYCRVTGPSPQETSAPPYPLHTLMTCRIWYDRSDPVACLRPWADRM
jgi:hypothetical protein